MRWVVCAISTVMLACGHGDPSAGAGSNGAASSASAPAPAASDRASAAPANDPVGAYCGAIEREWQTLDNLCTDEERGRDDYKAARTAVMAAVDTCKKLLAPSFAAGNIAFEKLPPSSGSDHRCPGAFKYGWAALPSLTRLEARCSPTEVVGLLSTGRACAHSFECRTQVCQKNEKGEGHCAKLLGAGEDCSTVDPTDFNPVNPCGMNLVCDREPPPPLLAGYPAGKVSRRADFPIAPGAVTIEPAPGGASGKPFTEYADSARPYLVRCFEAALAADPKEKGQLVLDVSSKKLEVGSATVSQTLRDCVVATLPRYGLDATGGLRVTFNASPGKATIVPHSGKCRETDRLGAPCERRNECGVTQCVDWKCAFDGPEACATDGDCDQTFSCQSGYCVGRAHTGACKSSGDCLAGICVEGQCRPMCQTKSKPRFDPD